MSKKIELTDDQVIEVRALAGYLNTQQISDYFGFSKDTFQEICKRDERVLRMYKAGCAEIIKDIAGSLISKARDGDTSCQIFYLKTKAGWKEAKDDTNVNVSGGLQITWEE